MKITRAFVWPALCLCVATGSVLAQSATKLYQTNCVNCHAEDGSGAGAGTQSLLRPEARGLNGPSDRKFFEAIRNGVPDTAMGAFGGPNGPLNDAEVWSLVVHVRELQERARREQEPAPHKRAEKGVIASQHAKYRIETVVERGVRTPWAVDWLPPKNRASSGDISSYAMLITERSGALRVQTGGKLSEPVKGVPEVFAMGQGGLMDVCVDPDYAENGWVYLSYSDPTPEGAPQSTSMTAIVRGKLERVGDTWSFTDMQTLWKSQLKHYQTGPLHFGSRIVISEPINEGPDKGRRYLYFCLGERGRGDLSQDLKRPNGKVHRIFTDGTVPVDNPFKDSAEAYATAWSFGHRNPQGMVMDDKGRLWVTEHGPRGGDELNLVLKGKNYGWPLVTFGINYNDMPWNTPWPDVATSPFGSQRDRQAFRSTAAEVEGRNIEMPVYVWLPSIAACGLSVGAGGPAGEAFPGWKGDLFAGGLAGEVVERIRVSNGDGEVRVLEREEVVRGMGRVRDVVTGPEGAIYVVLNGPDKVVRLSPVK